MFKKPYLKTDKTLESTGRVGKHPETKDQFNVFNKQILNVQFITKTINRKNFT